MVDDIEIFELSVGDSDLVLTEELKSNPGDVYVKREVVIAIWPPTQADREKNPNAQYSIAGILELLKEQDIPDRKLKSGASNGFDCVVFIKI